MAFKDGDAPVVAQMYELSIDFTNDGTTENFEFLCSTTLTEQFNEAMETFYTLCGKGNSTNIPAGQDYTIPFAIKMIVGEEDMSSVIYNLKHNQAARTNIPIRLDNLAYGKRTEFSGAVQLDQAGGNAENIGEITGNIKVSEGQIMFDDIPATGGA